MPSILVASKMKSGLPKPVHSAAPILHVPARTIPQPCYLKLGNKADVQKPSYPNHIPLKAQFGYETNGEALPIKVDVEENVFDTQIHR